MSSPKNLEKCLNKFENDKTVGMIANYALFSCLKRNKGNDTEKWIFNEAERFLKTMELKPQPQDHFIHVSGTMFIARCNIFNKLKTLKLSMDNFKAVERNNIQDLPHVLEVLLGWITTSQKNNSSQYYRITDPFSSEKLKYLLLIRYFIPFKFIRKIIRFIYRSESSSDGKIKIIKIFKIPLIKVH